MCQIKFSFQSNKLNPIIQLYINFLMELLTIAFAYGKLLIYSYLIIFKNHYNILILKYIFLY